MLDDYAFLVRGSEAGPIHSMLYWRSIWMSSYSNPFLHGLLGPLGAVVPSLFPIIIVAVWTFGLSWLIRQLLTIVQISRHQSVLAVSVAALTVAASINAFYTPQSFYWYAGSLPYTLPLALFSAYLALMLAMARGARSTAGLAGSALVSALMSFICAGFSELYLTFQLAFMSLLLAILSVFAPRAMRRIVFALIGAGWLGTVAGFAVQWTSPGRPLRTEVIWRYPQFQPVRQLSDLVSLGLHDLYDMALNPNTVLSFLLLFAAGLLVSRYAKPRALPTVFSKRLRNIDGRLVYTACLILQFMFVPVLWTHRSDNAQFLGRFSAAYMFVVIFNLALLAGLLLVIWRYRQIQMFLNNGSRHLSASVLVVTLIALTLLAAPQVRSIHITAQNLLFVTALSLLVISWWEWTSASASLPVIWLRPLPIVYTAAALLVVAAVISVPRYFVAMGALRQWSSIAFMLATTGLVCGYCVGRSISRHDDSIRASVKRASLVVFVIAYASIVIGQLRLLPNFAAFAREWDERHTLLLELKNSGETHVEIPPRAFDLKVFLFTQKIVPDDGYDDVDLGNSVLEFYGLESITLAEDG